MNEFKIYSGDIEELKDICAYNSAFSSLPSYRREKASRLKFEKDKKLCVLAGLLLKRATKDFGIEGEDENIVFSKNAKPDFNPDIKLHFSLSHSGSKALCCVSEHIIGCDIEKEDDGVDLSIANRFFAREEKEYLNKISDLSLRKLEFFALWTLKESLIKATGEGLRASLSSFSVCKNKEIKEKISYCGKEYRLFTLELFKGYKSAAAISV